MANNNSINNTSSILTVDNLQLDSNTLSSTSGTLIVQSDGTNPIQLNNGTSTTLNMSDAGEMTLPLQPYFFASLDTIITNATGDGTNVELGATQALVEISDIGGDFTVGDGVGTPATFTAPATGIYSLGMEVRIINIGSQNLFQLIINTTSFNMRSFELNPSPIKWGSGLVSFSHSAIVPLTAADTVTFSLNVGGSTKTVSIAESTFNKYTAVWGCLIA